MAPRTEGTPKRKFRVDESVKNDAGSGSEESTDHTLGLSHGPSFTVVLKNSHFCFPGGSKFLAIPGRFDVVAGQSQGDDWIGPGDWVKLSVVGDPSFKCGAVLVRSGRRGGLAIGEGFEKLASNYALQPGNRLSFTLIAPLEFSVNMCKPNGDANDSEEDETSDENGQEAGEEEPARSMPTIAQLMQQRNVTNKVKGPVGNKISKTALEIAKRKRYGRSCKTMREIGGGSGRDKGSGPSALGK